MIIRPGAISGWFDIGEGTLFAAGTDDYHFDVAYNDSDFVVTVTSPDKDDPDQYTYTSSISGWHMVTLDFSAGITLYIDTDVVIQEPAVDIEFGTDDDSNSIIIGGDIAKTPYNHAIDQVSYIDKTLNEDDISTLYSYGVLSNDVEILFDGSVVASANGTWTHSMALDNYGIIQGSKIEWDGNNATVYTSLDGEDWTQVSSGAEIPGLTSNVDVSNLDLFVKVVLKAQNTDSFVDSLSIILYKYKTVLSSDTDRPVTVSRLYPLADRDYGAVEQSESSGSYASGLVIPGNDDTPVQALSFWLKKRPGVADVVKQINLNPNPRMASTTTQTTIWQNAIRNPSFEVDTTGWNAGQNCNITVASDIATNIGTHVCQVTPTADLTSTGSAVLVSEAMTVPNGITYASAGVWVRRSGPNTPQKVRLLMLCYQGTTYLGQAGAVDVSTLAGAPTTYNHAALENVDLVAGTDTVRIGIYPTSGGTPWPSGAPLFVDGAQLLWGVRALPAYFDGDTPDDGDFTYLWNGTAHASTSEQRGVRVANYFGAVSDAIVSTHWAKSGQYSMRHIAHYRSPSSSYIDLGRDGGGIVPLVPGETYTVMVTAHTEQPRSIAPAISWTVSGMPDESKIVYADNAPGTYDLKVVFTVPTDPAATGWRVRLYAEVPEGEPDCWWDNVLIIHGEYDGEYFDGSTTFDGQYAYRWTGQPDNSTSEQYVSGKSYVLFGDGAWISETGEFSGMRLFVDGVEATSPANITNNTWAHLIANLNSSTVEPIGFNINEAKYVVGNVIDTNRMPNPSLEADAAGYELGGAEIETTDENLEGSSAGYVDLNGKASATVVVSGFSSAPGRLKFGIQAPDTSIVTLKVNATTYPITLEDGWTMVDVDPGVAFAEFSITVELDADLVELDQTTFVEGDEFIIDAVSITDTDTDYFDGDTQPTNFVFSWDGDANSSPSTKRSYDSSPAEVPSKIKDICFYDYDIVTQAAVTKVYRANFRRNSLRVNDTSVVQLSEQNYDTSSHAWSIVAG